MKAPKQVTRSNEDRKVYKMERRSKAQRKAALDRIVMQELHDVMRLSPNHRRG